MQNRKTKILLILFLATLAIGFHIYALDGIHGNIFDLIAKTDTEYSKDYSDSAFRKVKIGQSKEKVMELIGEPLSSSAVKRKKKSDKEVLWYSRSPSGGSYRLRIVELIEDKVVNVKNYFYID